MAPQIGRSGCCNFSADADDDDIEPAPEEEAAVAEDAGDIDPAAQGIRTMSKPLSVTLSETYKAC